MNRTLAARTSPGSHKFTRRSTRPAIATTAALALALGASACGSDSGAVDGEPSIKVLVGAPAVGFGLYYIAEEEGLFEKHGVDVEKVDGTSANAATLLISGKTDVVAGAINSAIPIALQDKEVSFIANTNNYSLTSFALVGKKGMSLDELRAKGTDCRITIPPPGNMLYGWWLDVAEREDIQCETLTSNDLAALTAGVVAGTSDAAVTTNEGATAVVAQGKADALFQPSSWTDAEKAAALADDTPFPAGGMLGLKDDLQENKEAVSLYLDAIVEAMNIVHDSTPEELAAILKKHEDFAQIPEDALTLGWTTMRTLTPYGPDAGHITEEDWTTSLTNMADWGIAEFTADTPELAYDKVVDMTYLDSSD